jgi:hypothetical protein
MFFSRFSQKNSFFPLPCQLLFSAQSVSLRDEISVKLVELLKKYASRAAKKTFSVPVAPPVILPALEIAPKSVPAENRPTQAIRSVLKGVDERKFQSNFEYRKSFILRAAATKDSQVLRDVLEIAEEHGLEGWEVVASNIKFLFTASPLSDSNVQAFLTSIPDLLDRLKKRKTDFLRYSSLQIQPQMTNADMLLLEIYSDFLSEIKKS